MNISFKVVASPISLWGLACWHVCEMWELCSDAWRVFNKMPSWNVVTWTTMMHWRAKGTGTTLTNPIGKMCSQTLLLLWGCWMHMPAWLPLNRAGCSHEKITQITWDSDFFLWNSSNQHVCKMWEHGGSLESVHQNAILGCGHLECHTWRICHTWA